MKYTSACLGLAIPPLSQRTSPSVETPLSEAAIAFSMSIAYEHLNHKLNHPTQAASPCFTMLRLQICCWECPEAQDITRPKAESLRESVGFESKVSPLRRAGNHADSYGQNHHRKKAGHPYLPYISIHAKTCQTKCSDSLQASQTSRDLQGIVLTWFESDAWWAPHDEWRNRWTLAMLCHSQVSVS
jgi:hypothetical protein